MKLRSDPFQIFHQSRTPPGLYARNKWLKESHLSSYKNDFDKTVHFLLSGQSADGSWGQSYMRTIKGLFGLHLTVRDAIEPVRKGIDWLINQTSTIFKRKKIRLSAKIWMTDLNGLPFTKGSAFILIASATLFLSSVFGRRNDPHILRIYDWLQAEGSKGSGRWCGWSSYNNILRAFVVHPHYSDSKAVALAIKNLQRVQKSSGKWEGPVPFSQTVNALAHIDSLEGDAQLTLAFRRIYETQRRDGHWGGSQPEWNSFLICHALKNKKQL